MQTLDNYKSFGPPSVSITVMTLEDKKILEEQHKEWKVDEQSEDLCEELNDGENTLENSVENCRDDCPIKDAVGNSQDEFERLNCLDNGEWR